MIMSNTLLGLFQSQNSCFFSLLFLFLTDVLLFSFTFSSWQMFHFSLPDRWIRADSGPKLLTNFNFPAPSTGRANFQHLLIDNFLPSIDFSCWFIFSDQEVHKNLFNFQCVDSAKLNYEGGGWSISTNDADALMHTYSGQNGENEKHSF